ncbi:Uncharacterized protein Adt_47869 [Abeliophyllum distichum]|uniref:Uncharacterized protein n=1 Tax=Abeliophyllum distichum TaxID=126358 RepID=A0ABD1NVH9_9LAMI
MVISNRSPSFGGNRKLVLRALNNPQRFVRRAMASASSTDEQPSTLLDWAASRITVPTPKKLLPTRMAASVLSLSDPSTGAVHYVTPGMSKLPPSPSSWRPSTLVFECMSNVFYELMSR